MDGGNTMTVLIILTVATLFYVIGRVHEGARDGGTVDLAARLAPYERGLRR